MYASTSPLTAKTEFLVAAAAASGAWVLATLLSWALPDSQPPHFINPVTPLLWAGAALVGIARSDRSPNRLSTAYGVAVAITLLSAVPLLGFAVTPAVREFWSLPRTLLAMVDDFLTSFAAALLGATLAATRGRQRSTMTAKSADPAPPSAGT
jgi:hypothetical protein